MNGIRFIHCYFDILIDVSAVQSTKKFCTQSEGFFNMLLWVLIDSGSLEEFGGRACVDPGSCVQWCMVKAADPRCPAGVPGGRVDWNVASRWEISSAQHSWDGEETKGLFCDGGARQAPNSPWLTVDYWCACRKMCFQMFPKQIKWKQVSVFSV